ncbi:hypothetical protein HK14_02245 [Acetobacter cibinongensis]|uniref:Uncharacterized protein n=1 Tax=Acetobacter cibinongensis TaxID=146475 RepID=A0A1Z5YWI9_9PROT|nr:hypothetical protein HK14_02245 [Acetobacter cibinongensis]
MIARILRITVGGALASTGAALTLSRLRTGSYGPGVNCTAHWLYGNKAADVHKLNVAHSFTGIATNTAAVLFWSWFYEKALGRKPKMTRALLATAALGPVSCLIDYKATPKRFTPGWELVFSRTDMAIIYFAMVLGMLSGVLPSCEKSESSKA